jgi:hypothetical protein
VNLQNRQTVIFQTLRKPFCQLDSEGLRLKIFIFFNEALLWCNKENLIYPLVAAQSVADDVRQRAKLRNSNPRPLLFEANRSAVSMEVGQQVRGPRKGVNDAPKRRPCTAARSELSVKLAKHR